MYPNIPKIDDPQWWRDRSLPLAQEEAFAWFNGYESGWSYDGDPSPEKAHAKLTSGKCSDGYYNCRDLFNKNPRICAIFADQLVRILSKAGIIGEFDWVIGSSYSAITVSYEVAKILGVSHGFTESKEDPDNPKKKKQVWKGNIPAGSKILQVEELITTLKTSMQVREAVLGSNLVEFLPHVATIIHRPGELPIDYGDEYKIIAFLEKAVWAGEPDECPYCKVGSSRYKPKENWAKLTGRA